MSIESPWYREQYNALRNAQIQETALSDALHRENVARRVAEVKHQASSRMTEKEQWNRERIARDLAENERNYRFSQEQIARNRAQIQERYATIEVPNGKGGFTAVPSEFSKTYSNSGLVAPSSSVSSTLSSSVTNYASPQKQAAVPSQSAPVYEAEFRSASPVNDIRQANSIPTAPKPRFPNTVTGNILNGGASLASGFVGDYIGDRASEAVFGSSNGTLSNIGGIVGGLVGGAVGAPLGGIGGIAGAGIGGAVGSFVGSFFDNLFGWNKPKVSDLAADLGKNRGALLPYTPLFTGGQMTGINYRIEFQATIVRMDNNPSAIGFTDKQIASISSGQNVAGKILSISDLYQLGSNWVANLVTSNGSFVLDTGFNHPNFSTGGARWGKPTLVRVFRSDGGVDTGDTPPNLNPVRDTNVLFVPNSPLPNYPLVNNYTNSGSFDALREDKEYEAVTVPREKAPIPTIVKPSNDSEPIARNSLSKPPRQIEPSPINNTTVIVNNNNDLARPQKSANEVIATSPLSTWDEAKADFDKYYKVGWGMFNTSGVSGIVAGVNSSYGAKPSSSNGGLKLAPVKTAPTVTTPYGTPVTPPTITKPPDIAKPRETTIVPPPPDLGTIALGVVGLGLAIGTIATGIDYLKNLNDQINQQTLPTAQQTNAKQGVCDAMQPQQCGFEGVKQATTEATNPIKDQTVANAGLLANVLSAIANLASTIANLFSNVVGKLDGIKEFLEKVARAAKLDKIYNLLTFITVVHNAQMLSNSLATTLMDSLSLGLATIGIKDENESPIDIQSIINKSVEDTVKGIIGTANYTTISDGWKKAVRVYQAGANITYQVRSLWDSARSLQELTASNVGKLANAIRRDGVVSENAYGAMADNPLMVNSAMTKLQNLDEAASHINSITSETYGVTETVAQIKKDQDDFKKLVKESQPLASVPNDAAKAKDDAAKLASVSPSISNIDLVKP